MLLCMRVRLVKKLAEQIDGIDLTRHRVGDFLLVSQRAAALLIAEGWAELAERRRTARAMAGLVERRATA